MSDEQSAVFLFKDDDGEMAEASQQARKTFGIFWRELSWEYRRIVPGLQSAAVKVAFSDPQASASEDEPAVEQMWVNELKFDGALISGTLLNSPNWLKSVKEGDEVQVPLDRVNDWMYAMRDQAYGAYTVNLLRSRMGRGERRSHDAAWGLNFGDPGQIRLVPPDYLNKQTKSAGLWQRIVGSRESVQDPEVIAATEHPMALAMIPTYEEQLSEDPSIISITDDDGLTFLHQFALAGAAAAVSLLLDKGADRTAKSNAGLTPLQMAQILNWREVIKLLS